VAAASSTPSIGVAGHVSTAHRLTLHITGSHFVPGSRVSIAVLNTSRWQVIARGATPAQRATTQVICGHDFAVCSRPNPRAGTIDFRLPLGFVRHPLLTWVCGHEHEVCSRPNPHVAANLLVLYRSTGDPGMERVTLR
jgi:hypothetical protein